MNSPTIQQAKPYDNKVEQNETMNTIYERRSVRKFTDQNVSSKIIQQVINAGKKAPSVMNAQPWQFYVLRNKEKIKAFSESIRKSATRFFLPNSIRNIRQAMQKLLHFPKGIHFLVEADPVFHDAPIVIFITAPKESENADLDIGMCAENMMLSAKSLGLDTCPVGFGKLVEQNEIYTDLRIPPDEHVHLALILGYGAEQTTPPERAKGNVMYIL